MPGIVLGMKYILNNNAKQKIFNNKNRFKIFKQKIYKKEEETLKEKCKNRIYNLIKLSNPEKLICVNPLLLYILKTKRKP